MHLSEGGRAEIVAAIARGQWEVPAALWWPNIARARENPSEPPIAWLPAFGKRPAKPGLPTRLTCAEPSMWSMKDCSGDVRTRGLGARCIVGFLKGGWWWSCERRAEEEDRGRFE